MRVWRDYDQQGLDRQLNLRQRTPEHADFFARWAEEGRQVRGNFPGYREIAYGATQAERLDYFPAAQEKAPLLAMIHGGYWQSLDKGDFSYPAPVFREAGIAYASLNYTLAPQARVGQMVEEVRRAMILLHEQAGKLGHDRERIFVVGHSAGGHLAAMAAITDWAALGQPRDLLKGVCSISGLYELEPLHKSYQQPVLQLDGDSVAQLSPLRQLPASLPPTLCAVGSEEPEEFLDQQADFLAACRQKGLPVAEIALPGRHHFSAVDAVAEPDHPLHRAVRRLIMEGALP
ncbi:MAG: alpha/beta hydrolase [Rhodovibrionaceae bacterium]